MRNNNYQPEKDKAFIKSWEEKRKKRLYHAVIESLFFSIPLSIIFSMLDNRNKQIEDIFLLFIITFITNFIFTYSISFTYRETRFQKLKKEELDNQDNKL